jgi:hypothetical protein
MLRSRHFLPLAIVVPGLLGLASLSHRRAAALREQVADVDRHVLVPSPTAARVLSLGYTELVADLYWVRMLVYYGDGLIHDTGMPDTESLVKLVNTLDPTFRKPYIWGAYATTFRQPAGPNRLVSTPDEYRASVDILRRGVQVFPGDWELAWVLGVRLYLDLKGDSPEEQTRNQEEGATYIERAMHLPDAPRHLPILAASLRTKLGQKEKALRDLREMILITEDEKARAELVRRYAAMASDTASHELAEAAAESDREWSATLPYAPRSLYILLGPTPSPALDLEKMAAGLTLGDGTALAPGTER